MKYGIRWVAAAAALAGGAQAQAAAVVFTGTGNTATLVFSMPQDGAVLLATVQFTLKTLSTTSATFETLVTNSSSGPGDNTLMSFGIDVVSPTLKTVATDSGIWDASLKDTLPTFNKVALCLWSAGGCSGGDRKDGLAEGGSSSFMLTLTTDASFANGITFTSPYGIKFQSVGTRLDSFEFAGCIQGTAGCAAGGGGGGGGSGGQVPEPSALALVGIAALAYGLNRRLAAGRPARLA